MCLWCCCSLVLLLSGVAGADAQYGILCTLPALAFRLPLPFVWCLHHTSSFVSCNISHSHIPYLGLDSFMHNHLLAAGGATAPRRPRVCPALVQPAVSPARGCVVRPGWMELQAFGMVPEAPVQLSKAHTFCGCPHSLWSGGHVCSWDHPWQI